MLYYVMSYVVLSMIIFTKMCTFSLLVLVFSFIFMVPSNGNPVENTLVIVPQEELGNSLSVASTQLVSQGSNVLVDGIMQAIGRISSIIETIRQYTASNNRYLDQVVPEVRIMGDRLIRMGADVTTQLLNQLNKRIANQPSLL